MAPATQTPPEPEVDEFGLPKDPAALHSAAVLLQERLRVFQAEEAKRQEAAAAAAAAPPPPPDPLVPVEWLKTPRSDDCHINNHYYRGRGPIIAKSTNTITRPGERQQLPADAARVLHEAGFVRVLDGHDLIRWTDPGIVPAGIATDAPDPRDERAWAALAK